MIPKHIYDDNRLSNVEIKLLKEMLNFEYKHDGSPFILGLQSARITDGRLIKSDTMTISVLEFCLVYAPMAIAGKFDDSFTFSRRTDENLKAGVHHVPSVSEIMDSVLESIENRGLGYPRYKSPLQTIYEYFKIIKNGM